MITPAVIALAIILGATIFGGVFFAFYLLAQNGRLMLRLESLENRLAQQGVLGEGPNLSSMGTPPGSVLNDFALPIMGGGTMTLSQWRGRKVALIFVSPRCKHSADLLPDLAALSAERAEADPAPVIISTGSLEENQQFLGGHQIGYPVLLQEDSEVAALYRALATPMAYLVDENGVTQGRAAVGPTAIRQLLHGQSTAAGSTVKDHSPSYKSGGLASSRIKRDGLKAGTTAPDFTLPALDGSQISLSSLRGRQVLLVFSDPNCKPCNALLPKLEDIQRKSKDLQVLVIGRGDPVANREKVRNLGLTFPVALQKSWEISRAYGMFATPIGYLVDEDGVLVEDVGVGVNQILAVAARRRNARVPANN